jgi:8-amino-7-oxononanoate synthase
MECAVLDFTSVLYLGMRHPHTELRPWRQLTTGRPVALQSPAAAERVADGLARLTGVEQATMGPSSTHLFWDIFEVLSGDHIAIFVDDGTYPIARWGVERAAAKGVRSTVFPKHDPAALRTALDQGVGDGAHPVIVTDTLCPLTGRPAPLPEYARLVRRHGGFLVVDDTQGLGLLGRTPSPGRPYGTGGGGTLAWFGLSGPDMIVISSLAKGFGVPIAMIGSGRRTIEQFKALSQTRLHCSPPSIAAIHATENALRLNAIRGSALRSRLIGLVRLFRAGLQSIGMAAYGGLFPFQTLRTKHGDDAGAIHAILLRHGIRTVLHRAPPRQDVLLSFVITASHTAPDIIRTLRVLRGRYDIPAESMAIAAP